MKLRRVLLVLILVASCILLAVPLLATPSLETLFVSKYPATAETKLDRCELCHMPVVKDFLNSYGLALRDAKLDFLAVEGVDSDGDGVTNIEEIKAGELPGSHAVYAEYYIFKNKKGEVHFNHADHVNIDTYKIDGICNDCHDPKDGFPRKFNDSEDLKVEAHRLCKSCHKKSGSENAPQACDDCHDTSKVQP